MEPAEHLSAIRREAQLLAGTVRTASDRPVPSCPGWTVADLARHAAAAHAWAEATVRTRATERVGHDLDAAGEAGELTGDALAEWYLGQVDKLADTFAGVDPGAPVWTFSRIDRTNGFWLRRQAQELLVHRWDAEAAAGTPSALDPELAADGVDEYLTVFVPLVRRRATSEGAGETVHVHRTDGEGEWLVRFVAGSTNVEVERAHAKGAVALRGASADLLLYLWRRTGPERLEVLGDRAVLDRWPDLVPPV